MSEQLRDRLLEVLEQHERSEPSEFVQDTKLAELTGAEVDEVQRQMDALEREGFINTANNMTCQSARITPAGLQLVGERAS
jgi:hypothetical protein